MVDIANPLLNVGLGLLAESGPSLQPNNLGRGLLSGVQSAQAGQQQALRNQIVRSRLEGDARKRRAASQLGGLLAGEGGKNSQLFGLLAEASPGTAAQVAAQRLSPRESETERLLARLRDPDLPARERELIEARIGRSGGSGNSAMDILKAMNLRGQIEDRQDERTQERQERADERVTQAQSVDDSLDTLLQAGNALETLKGTGVDTGVVFRPARVAALRGRAEAAAEVARRNPTEQTLAEARRLSTQLAAVENFDRLTTDEALRRGFSGQKGIRGTNFSLDTLLRTKPGANLSVPANEAAVANLLKKALNNAKSGRIEADPDLVQAAEGFIANVDATTKAARVGSRLTNRTQNPDIPLPRNSVQDLSRRLNSPITEQDIKDTMRTRGMTRQQVIDFLNETAERRAGGG